MRIEPPLDDFKRYPAMARWFHPWLLFKLLSNVIVSSVFGWYADRRLMVAALDTASAEKHVERATRLKSYFMSNEDDVVWLDFVADLGDGFDSTYAVASLLARPELEIGGTKLKRGQALIMGGDEVYPAASSPAYRNQLRQPYAWALPDPDRKSDEGIPVFAIPGNHDWYDGLVLFLAFFCREKPWHLGGWRSQQRRSYFAIQLTNKWWLWATDVQLADNMDQPQADYFKTIARAMPEGSKIILCGAEPGWLYTDTNRGSWDIADYTISLAEEIEDRKLTVPILLSGDTHHYSRYSAKDGTQFITSGGGGAFLHPTHQLLDKVTVKWSGKNKDLSLTTSPALGHAENGIPACFPSKRMSRLQVLRNLYFAATNWDFSILMGVIYWIAGVGLTVRDQWDAYLLVGAAFLWALMGYTINQEKSTRPTVLIASAVHACAHIFVVICATKFFASWNETHFVLYGEWYSGWKWLFFLFVEMGAVGGIVGSTIFGVNLVITCGLFRMNSNDAFSALRLGGYKNFLRIRITNEIVEIFSIGLTRVPRRDDWIPNPKTSPHNPNESVFVPKTPLQPHLIEKIEV